jgi:hypothetical protein
MAHVAVAKRAKDLPTIGWREWVELPDLGGAVVKAKVDTGARTSAIHAFDVEFFVRRGRERVRFTLHPLLHGSAGAVVAESDVVDRRRVRSSDGRAEVRPVILTSLRLMGQTWPVELTLTARDEMGFRMLLGRQAVRRRFRVDPGRSFYNDLPHTAPRGARPKKKTGA